jgi:hypothetical protein
MPEAPGDGGQRILLFISWQGQESNSAKTLWILRDVREKIMGYILDPMSYGNFVTCTGGEVVIAISVT